MGRLEKSEQHHHRENVRKPSIIKEIFHIERKAKSGRGDNKDVKQVNNYELKADVARHSTPQTINTFRTVTTPPNSEHSERYCKKLYRNRRQTGSICGGIFLMMVSGLHIGWGMWRTHGWATSTHTSLLIFSIMSWSIGAIFGGFIGSGLVTTLRKNVIYFFVAVIMTIGNVLYIIWDGDYPAIVIGRLMMSVAHGMVFIVLIIQAGENASKNMRATVISTINCLLFSAIFISVHVIATVDVANGNVSSERILGSIAMAFVLGSVLCTLTVHVETVPHLLRKNEQLMAMENMKRLRAVFMETPQMTTEMAEMNEMITQDQRDNQNVFVNGNVKPLIVILLIRLMAALTNNLLLNIVMIGSCEMILFHYQYAPLMILAPRLAMSVVQVFYADVFGRKIQLIVSAMFAGVILIGLAVVWNAITITDSINHYIPSLFCMWFQLFCSVGIQQMADVYLAEAFSTAKKPWSLSFVLGIEHIFQIFMIGMAFTTVTSGGLNALLFTSGIFIIAAGIVLVFILPETKGMTLKATRDRFRSEKFFNLL